MAASTLKSTFVRALQRLRQEKAHRAARDAAFRVKMLAELHRHWDHPRFDEIKTIAKGLEDALGEYGDLVELPTWLRKHSRVFPFRTAALKARVAKEVQRDRREGFATLKKWMATHGWHEGGAAFKKLHTLLEEIAWPSDSEAHANTARHMVKFLLGLQADVDDGKYTPSSKKFYSREEYSSRVHQLRIDIRRFGQYAAFSTDDFRIVSEKSPGVAAFPEFFFLSNTDVAKSRYARLPYKAGNGAWPIPESALHAVNFFIDELDTAKSFALSVSRVCTVAERLAGLKWNPELIVRSFPAMESGTDRTTDDIALDIIAKCRRSKLFTRVADGMK